MNDAGPLEPRSIARRTGGRVSASLRARPGQRGAPQAPPGALSMSRWATLTSRSLLSR
jgi:hypothetical protein